MYKNKGMKRIAYTLKFKLKSICIYVHIDGLIRKLRY